MLNALLTWLQHKLGRWLLQDELQEEARKDQERARRQKEIMDANYTVDDVERDLDRGEF